MKEKHSYIYIMTNKNKNVLYIGVTSNLVRRVYEHRNKLRDGFTSKYNLTQLVYFEKFGNIRDAITREKQLKAGSRAKKEALINTTNPQWEDLWEHITQ